MSRRLAIDIGNTHIKLGVHDTGAGWIGKWALSTEVRRTADEYRLSIVSLLGDIDAATLNQVVISSVVPLLTPALMRVGKGLIGRHPLEVSPPGFGLPVRYQPPESLGADRFVNALAAWHLWHESVVVVDAGTTATVDAVNAEGEFIGGAIAPGPHFLAAALVRGTAKLPYVPPSIPDCTLGQSTKTAIQVGVGYGFIGMVEALVDRAWSAIGHKAPVVLTGGWSRRIQPHLHFPSRLQANLTLDGLIIAADMDQAR